MTVTPDQVVAFVATIKANGYRNYLAMRRAGGLAERDDWPKEELVHDFITVEQAKEQLYSGDFSVLRQWGLTIASTDTHYFFADNAWIGDEYKVNNNGVGTRHIGSILPDIFNWNGISGFPEKMDDKIFAEMVEPYTKGLIHLNSWEELGRYVLELDKE